MTTSATLAQLRSYPRPSAAGLRDVARQQGALLRRVYDRTDAPADNTTPAVAATPTRVELPKLTYALVNAMLAQLPPCHYALRKVDGDVSFFEVSEYKGSHRIVFLVGAPGSYRRVTMKLPLQYLAVRHLLDDPAGAVKLYADERSCCSKCHSPLTNALSRSRGLGPDCWDKVGF